MDKEDKWLKMCERCAFFYEGEKCPCEVIEEIV